MARRKKKIVRRKSTMIKKNKTMANGWIIFWIIFCWPLGFLFLFKKLNNDKSAIMKDTKIYMVVSYIMIGFGVFYSALAFSSSSASTGNAANNAAAGFVLLILFGGGGVLLNLYARNIRKTGEKYKKYISLIINQNQSSIDNIASAAGVPYATAEKDLQKMINAGYFAGAFIDVSQRAIISSSFVTRRVSISASASARADVTMPTVQEQMKIVACGNCGANGRVTVGQIVECEYCGSALQ